MNSICTKVTKYKTLVHVNQCWVWRDARFAEADVCLIHMCYRYTHLKPCQEESGASEQVTTNPT